MARRLRGDEAMLRRLEQVLDKGPKAAAIGLRNSGVLVLGTAAENAPVKDGDLRESGILIVGGKECARATAGGQVIVTGTPRSYGSGNVVAKIVFTAEHAVVQHERLDLQHNSGGPKYLERAFGSEASRVLEPVAEEVRKGIR